MIEEKNWNDNRRESDYAHAQERESFAGWLAEAAPWQFFLTLTFRERIGTWGAERRLARYLFEISSFSNTDRGLFWVFAFEMQRARGVPHCHGIFACTSQSATITGETLQHCWRRNGYSRIVPAQTGAALRYLSKYVFKSLDSKIFLSLGESIARSGLPYEDLTERGIIDKKT